MTICQDYVYGDGGVPPKQPGDTTPAVRSIQLPAPMTAGQPYSLSVDAGNTPRAEFWGSNAQCGYGYELLWSGDIGTGIFCFTFHPTKAHSHIVMVWRGEYGTHGDIGLCPGSACP